MDVNISLLYNCIKLLTSLCHLAFVSTENFRSWISRVNLEHSGGGGLLGVACVGGLIKKTGFNILIIETNALLVKR